MHKPILTVSVRLHLDETDDDPGLQTDREHVFRRLHGLGLMPHVTPSINVDVAYPVTDAAIMASKPHDGRPTITLMLTAPVDNKQLPLGDLRHYAPSVVSAAFVDLPELECTDKRGALLAFIDKLTSDLNRASRHRGDRHSIAIEMIRDANHYGRFNLIATGPTESLLPALCNLHARLVTSSQLAAALPRKKFAPPTARSDQAELASA